ncbi:MAG: right-handed parallel beta-helix repeat-containing protein [Prolixibacteraceae bacterium]
MRKAYLLALLLSYLFFACDKDDTLLQGDIKASKIESKTEYYAPFVLEQGNVEAIEINGEKRSFYKGILELPDAGFYKMVLDEQDTVLFVLLNAERVYDNRVYAEWGLKEWVPTDLVLSEDFSGDIEVVCPSFYLSKIATPVVLRVKNREYTNTVNLECSVNKDSVFLMKRGIGSTSVPITNGQIEAMVGPQKLTITVAEASTSEIKLSGKIDTDYVVPQNSVLHINADLEISILGSLSIQPGTIVLIDEGVNITNQGPIEFNGEADNPIFVTCSDSEKYFGGFISEGSKAKIIAKNSFFTRFSYHSGEGYQYGHAQHQALFYSTNTEQTIHSCYFFDSPGQVFFTLNVELTLSNLVIQRVKTTGQLNFGHASVDDCYFADYPEYSSQYKDDDNDGLYLNDIDGDITNTMFLYCKDDGLDSGGDKGGIVNVTNCVFEGCFHEGIAMSSVDPAVKIHTITNCIFTNCQQGVELGFSSSNHQVVVDNCTLYGNYIGVRYGDCYDRDIDGKMLVKNSAVSGNYKNTWNMLRKIWSAKPENLSFINTAFNE